MRIYQHFIFELFFFQLNVESSQNCIVYLFTNHMTYSNFGQVLEYYCYFFSPCSPLTFFFSLFFTFGVHSIYLIVGFAFNCVLVFIFSRLIRPSVLFTSPVILVRRICLAISSFLNWRLFRLFSWPLHWIKKLSFRKKLKAGHLQ